MNELRCYHRRPDGSRCDQKVGDASLGYFRTICPRCKRPVVFISDGALSVNHDGHEVRVIVGVQEQAMRGQRKSG